MEKYYYKVIPTAGGSLVIFRDWRVYRRLFNANSGLVMRLPNMSAAG